MYEGGITVAYHQARDTGGFVPLFLDDSLRDVGGRDGLHLDVSSPIRHQLEQDGRGGLEREVPNALTTFQVIPYSRPWK